MSDYLYDLDGDVIAFRRSWDDEHVFEPPARAEPSGRPTRPLEFPNRFAYDDVEQLHRAG